MTAVEYDRFRGSPNCGWITGTVWTGPRICDRTPKFTTDHQSAVNGRVCGTHAHKARRDGAAVEPIKEN